MYDESGNPCSSTTASSPEPSSTAWNDRPFAWTRVPGRVSRVLLVHEAEPALVLVDLAAGRGEERLLDLLRDGAAAVRAERAVVDLADRTHLRGGPREEPLVGGVQVSPDQLLLADLVAQVLGDRDHGVPRDPVEAARRQRRREQHAVPHDEHVLAGPVGDVAVDVQHDGLVVAPLDGLDLRQRGVAVLARRLGRARVPVGVVALAPRT